MSKILFLIIFSFLTSCSGSIGWGTHKISIDADEYQEKMEQSK